VDDVPTVEIFQIPRTQNGVRDPCQAKKKRAKRNMDRICRTDWKRQYRIGPTKKTQQERFGPSGKMQVRTLVGMNHDEVLYIGVLRTILQGRPSKRSFVQGIFWILSLVTDGAGK
jgi:hypothetical protein